jgi:hypothetical protein
LHRERRTVGDDAPRGERLQRGPGERQRIDARMAAETAILEGEELVEVVPVDRVGALLTAYTVADGRWRLPVAVALRSTTSADVSGVSGGSAVASIQRPRAAVAALARRPRGPRARTSHPRAADRWRAPERDLAAPGRAAWRRRRPGRRRREYSRL